MAQSLVHGNVNDAVRLENIIESEVIGSYDPLADNLQNIDDGNAYRRSKRGGVGVSSDVVAGVIGASSGAASGAASAVNLVSDYWGKLREKRSDLERKWEISSEKRGFWNKERKKEIILNRGHLLDIQKI